MGQEQDGTHRALLYLLQCCTSAAGHRMLEAQCPYPRKRNRILQSQH